MTKEFFERGKQIAKWADNQPSKQGLSEAEMEELRFLLILSKMKENAEKIYGK